MDGSLAGGEKVRLYRERGGEGDIPRGVPGNVPGNAPGNAPGKADAPESSSMEALRWYARLCRRLWLLPTSLFDLRTLRGTYLDVETCSTSLYLFESASES